MKTKIYIITGATSGIGKALAEILSVNNIVFAGYRNEEKAQELKQISSNIKPFYVDYGKPETISTAIDYIKSQTQTVDTLINIAGCVVAGPIENIPITEIKRQFDVNVFGHLEFSQGLFELLENGKIINISSMASYGIFPFVSPYCASKRCLDMLFNSFLLESKKKIKIVSVKPGVISTPLWNKSIQENSKQLCNCNNYEKEMQFMVKNAQKNEEKGLSVDNVTKLILKIDSMKNPKLSYTIGKDALFAKYLSKLPQNIVNSIVKFGLKIRMK